MKKLTLCLILISAQAFSCSQCLKYYAEQKLYESEIIIDDMLESHTEENIPFFFFMLGRNNALYEMRMQMEQECKADLL